VDPAGARLLRWALAAGLIGMGCCGAAVVLAFAWAATGGRGGWLTASHWLTRAAYGFLGVVVVLGVLLARRRKRAP
jgi:ABC-type Fe3+ transport system permease subunit